MNDLLELVIKNLVSNENEVSIKKIEKDSATVVYEVRVNKADMGKVIGKQGRIAKAIRTLTKAVASKEHKKVMVDFVDEGK